MRRSPHYELESVVWSATGNGEFPYNAFVRGERWVIRVNEWPDDPTLYTLFVGSEPVLELLAWPDAWRRPDGP